MTDVSMSSFLLYGVCSATRVDDAALASVVERQTGPSGGPLGCWENESLALLYSPVDPAVLRAPDTSTVLAYRDIIAAANAACPVVPLRFGTCVETAEEGRALLARHRAALEQHLEWFEGRVEVGVRLTLTAPPTEDATTDDEDPTSGAAYLKTRRDERARIQKRDRTIVSSYRTAAGAACVEMSCDLKPQDDTLLSLAFLVPQAEAAAVCDRLTAVQVEAVEDAHVVGPWAPYSFTDL